MAGELTCLWGIRELGETRSQQVEFSGQVTGKNLVEIGSILTGRPEHLLKKITFITLGHLIWWPSRVTAGAIQESTLVNVEMGMLGLQMNGKPSMALG